MGYTLNRVSLFALGILVDDAIVAIENIARYCGKKTASDQPVLPRLVA
jgi:multidrug efflux pump subunit AcrB